MDSKMDERVSCRSTVARTEGCGESEPESAERAENNEREARSR